MAGMRGCDDFVDFRFRVVRFVWIGLDRRRVCKDLYAGY